MIHLLNFSIVLLNDTFPIVHAKNSPTEKKYGGLSDSVIVFLSTLQHDVFHGIPIVRCLEILSILFSL
jgi:hypothetical protein